MDPVERAARMLSPAPQLLTKARGTLVSSEQPRMQIICVLPIHKRLCFANQEERLPTFSPPGKYGEIGDQGTGENLPCSNSRWRSVGPNEGIRCNSRV